MKEIEQTIQQTTMLLPYFDYEVPSLRLPDGILYVPLIALCEMLGLCMSYGNWTVCYSTRETSLHLLPGWFLYYTGNRDHLFYDKGDTYDVS